MTATIVITTKNRKEDLCRALESCVRQDGAPEVLVIDDGSTDGTSELVHTRFPAVRVVRYECSGGLIVRRNDGARLAGGEVIISIDDDAEFSDPGMVQRVLGMFEEPRIAAVAIPFININSDNTLKQCAPDSAACWVTNEFIGTAHALRRREFLECGGYREVLFHQGEEGDLCIRLLQRGRLVRMGYGAPILHYESPRRSFERINVFGQRNLLLFAWHNVPMPEMPLHLLVTVVNGLRWGIRRGVLGYRLKGLWLGVCAMFAERGRRAPVSRRTYWLYRRVKKNGPLRIESIPSAGM